MDSSAWQKSSYSGSSNACVEVRTVSGMVELRESDEGHLVLRTPPNTFAAFLQAIKAGEFNHHV
ncbi:DUF397 domain-containing protein [Streptomyces kaniharaensis]|uniref:DUF397 domain-containing protein n=1 Tax=Streptomyces kaniharaensis TaxID=212423 RepID=A0A6N7KQ16_9ACTN|nr:DUF397 domain-containing protein [Streptomyces kaniharaensis]MQS12825.1 DUF397 domain-containing protein [Streptomyces kaniharaensis]